MRRRKIMPRIVICMLWKCFICAVVGEDLISVNWRFYITKLWHNKRLFFLQPLSHYFIVYEKMCHQSRDCRSGWSNKFRINSNSKVAWPLLIRNCLSLLFMNLWNHSSEDCWPHWVLSIVCSKLFITIHVFGLDCLTYRLIMNFWNHTRENCESHRMLSIVCSKLFIIIHRFL